MTQLTINLVGMHFRPPAKFVLASLPAGTELRLQPEPGNPYDEKAVQVHAAAGAIPASQMGALDEALQGTGFDARDVAASEVWLGYLADSDGKLAQGPGLSGNREAGSLLAEGPVEAKLGFGPDGKPQVIIESAVP